MSAALSHAISALAAVGFGAAGCIAALAAHESMRQRLWVRMLALDVLAAAFFGAAFLALFSIGA